MEEIELTEKIVVVKMTNDLTLESFIYQADVFDSYFKQHKDSNS